MNSLTAALAPTSDIFKNDRLSPLQADEAAMSWQDLYADHPTDELKANLTAYQEWAGRKRHTPFSKVEEIETRRRVAKEDETLTDWALTRDDGGFDHVARKRGFLDRYESAAAIIPREELRPKLARDLFITDITSATPEQLRTGVPQLQVAKKVLGIDDPSDEAFDAAMGTYISKQLEKRDRRNRVIGEAQKLAVTQVERPFSSEPAEGWKQLRAKLEEEGLSKEDLDDSMRTAFNARIRMEEQYGDVLPLSRRIYATIAADEQTAGVGAQAFTSVDEAAEAFANLPEEDFPKMAFALSAFAEAKGQDVEGFFSKVKKSFDRGAASYGLSLDNFMRGRQAAEFTNRIESGEPIFVPLDEASTPREAAMNAFRNLATGQGIDGFGLGADREKQRRELTPQEREILGQQMQHLQRLQTAKQSLNDHRAIVNRVQSENRLAQGVYDATGSLPYMGMAFLGPIGQVVNGAVMSEDNFRQLKQAHPDVDDGKLRTIADAAAVPQALIERFQAKTLFGKFPVANGLLKKLEGGGFLRQLAVRQAAEFSQESIQDAMLPIAQQVLESFGEDMPEVNLRAELGELVDQAPRTFFATLPLTILGAGGSAAARRYRHVQLDQLMGDRQGMQLSGLTGGEADFVLEGANTEERVQRFQEAWKGKTLEQRQQASEAVTKAENAPSSLPVIKPRSDGGTELSFPDGTSESYSTEEEAVAVHSEWVRNHFEQQRQVSQQAIESGDIEAAFEEESARFSEARPGVTASEVEAETLGDLHRRGKLTISQAWQRVKDYAAQTGTSLEGFTPSNFDNFRVEGSASSEARFVDGVLEGAITLAKGEKNVATLWEEQSETYIAAQLNKGGTWTDSELLGELRRVEKQTGRKFLAGESRENLIEGFSFVARNYAAGNFADLNFGQKLKHVLNLLAEKIAAAFSLSKDMKRLSQAGELSPALESAIRKSLGFEGNQEAEMGRIRNAAAYRIAGETLSVSREGDSLFSLPALISVKSGGRSASAKVWKNMANEVRGLRDRFDSRSAAMATESKTDLEERANRADLADEFSVAENASRLESELSALEERREEERAIHSRNKDRFDFDEVVALQDEGERLLAKWGENSRMRLSVGAEAKKTVAARFKGIRDKEAARHRAAMKEIEAQERSIRRDAKGRMQQTKNASEDRDRGNRRQAGRFAEQQRRLELLQDIATLEVIAQALPAQVRSKFFTGFRKLVELRTTEARQNYLTELLPKVETALESHLRKEFRTAIKRWLKKGAAKVSEGRNRSSSIGSIAAAIFEEAKKWTKIAADPAGAVGGRSAAEKANERSDELTRLIEAPGDMDSEQLEELIGRQQAVELFGDYENANSARLEEALAFLEGAYDEGRLDRVNLILARRELSENRVSRILKGFGLSGPSETRDRTKRTRKDEGFLKGLSEGFLGGFLSGSQTMRRLRETTSDPDAIAAAEDMENAFLLAELAEQDMNIADNEKYASAAYRILGVKTKYGFAKKLSELSRNKEGDIPVTKIEGARSEKVSVPIRHVEAILSEELDALEAGGVQIDPAWRDLDEADLTQLEAEWELYNELSPEERGKKRNLIFTRHLAAGQRKTLGELSQLEGLNWYLVLRQPDQFEKLRKMGWDSQTLTELEAWLKPEVKALGQWMVSDIRADRDTIDAIHRDEKGIGLAILDGPYFPVTNEVSAAELESLALDGIEKKGGGRSVGSLKMRVPNQAEPAAVNALAVYLSHKAQMNFWKANVGVLREWGGVIRNDKFATGVRNAMGSEYYRTLERRLKRIESGGSLRSAPLLGIERLFKKFLRGFALGTLGGRVSTLAVNTAAFANVTLEVPITELLVGMRDVVANPRAFADAWKSPAIQRRLKGGASFEAQLAKKRTGHTNPILAVADAAANPAMELINLVDTSANTVAAAFVWERTRKLALGDGATEAEARAAADRKVEIVLARAAQPTATFARSEFELTLMESPLALPFAMFMSEARKTTSTGMMAVRQILTGKGIYSKGMAWQQAIMALVAIKALEFSVRAVVAAATKGGDDEDEEYLGRLEKRISDPKAWTYALTADHLTAIPGIGEAGKSGLAASINSEGAKWIVENTMPADFAERWNESEARYFDSNPNPLAKTGKGIKSVTKAFSADLTAEERADKIIDSAQVFGTLIPGAALAAQTANVAETGLGAFNSFGGSLSDGDRVQLIKARYKRLQRELDEIHGPTMVETGKTDRNGNPKKKTDETVKKAKDQALAEHLRNVLAPLSEELRMKAIKAIQPSDQIEKISGISR